MFRETETVMRKTAPSFSGHSFIDGMFSTPVMFDPNDPTGSQEPAGIIIQNEPTPTPEPAPAPAPEGKTFTAEDIERARREEKDKLYGQLHNVQEELKRFRTAEEERAAAAKAEQERLAAEAEERRLAEMSALERVQEVERTFTEKLAEMERKNSENEALLERERRYNELVSYRAARLQEDGIAESIAPQFLDYIWGENEAEIDQAIAIAQQKTSSILEEVNAAQQQFRQQQRGTTVTVPPVGPMENESTYKTVTADDIRNMDMATYAKQRQALLGGASNSARNRGLYG
jgi:hypothetical protein